jgi:integrase
VGFTTKRATEEFLATVTVAKLRGEFIRPEDSQAKIGELAVPWLANQVHLKPSSYRPIEIARRLHVKPRWGDVAVSKILHSDVQAWVTSMSSSRGVTTVLRAYGVLASILEVAVRDRRVRANTARGVNLPRKVRKGHAYLAHAQVELLASNAGEFGTLVRFRSCTGLRWGEAVGLRVMDLDMLRRRAQVQ